VPPAARGSAILPPTAEAVTVRLLHRLPAD